MTRPSERTPLESAEQIGVIGDIQGDLGPLLNVASALSDAGVTVLIACGNLGVLSPRENGHATLFGLSAHLASRGQTLYWVDGNHDDHAQLLSFPVLPNGLRPISENVVHLPRGFRATLHGGRTLAALGGATSIDREQRTPGTDWWPEEAITDADLAALGTEAPVDILVGHDAPLDVMKLDAELERTENQWSARDRAYARAGRRAFHTGFSAVRPSLYVGAHYHFPVDEVVGYFDGANAFRTRVVLLDSLQGSGASCAILTVETLELTFLTSAGKQLPPVPPQVTALTMADEGRWLLRTIGSSHVLDLDRRTIQRIPGTGRAITTSDGVHDLRTLDVCEIGRSGRWTMRGEYAVEYYWHVSSIIRHIERLPDSNSPATTPR